MLRRSSRKRKEPVSRQDMLASAARRRVMPPRTTGSNNGTIQSEVVARAYTTSTTTHPGVPAHTTASLMQMPTQAAISQGISTSTTMSITSPATQMTIPDPDVSTCVSYPGLVNNPGNTSQVYESPIQLQKASDELGCNVAHNIKQKIIAGEYIDLATLLTNSQSTTIDTHKIAFVQGDLIIQPKQQQQKNTTIELWTDAYLVFMNIYCMAHTDTFADMLKYMSVIRLGAKRSTVGWKLYDEQFRLRRAINPASSWATIDSELWLLYMHGSLTPLASP